MTSCAVFVQNTRKFLLVPIGLALITSKLTANFVCIFGTPNKTEFFSNVVWVPWEKFSEGAQTAIIVNQHASRIAGPSWTLAHCATH